MQELTKRELARVLAEWPALLERISDLRERIASHSYSVTACYNGTGAGTPSGLSVSKVERFYIIRAELEEEISELRQKAITILSAITQTSLSTKERMLVDWIMSGRSLSSFAREKKIYKSSVYKMRDRAISKIHRVLCNCYNTK